MTFEDWIYSLLQLRTTFFHLCSNSIEMGQEMAFTKLNYVPPKLRSITYFSNFRPFLLYDDPKDVSSPYCFSKCCHHHRARISNVQGRWLSRDSYICALPNLDTQTIWHRQSSGRIYLQCRRTGSGRFLRKGNGSPDQYSCLRKFMDKQVWQATLHGVAKRYHWAN